ncbi:MAG: hypothetical protein IPO72_18965 [Saprospiraceae bacterium]|nr:hypothetical protein [Candidatus Vicinibacter affinis]
MSNFIELRNNIQTNRQALLQKQEELFIASRVLERYQEELIRKAKKEKPDKKTDKKKADTSGKPFFSKIPIQKTDLKGSPIKGGPIFGDPIKLDKKLNELTKVKNNFLTEITTIESQLVDFYQQFWALASPRIW